VVGITNFAVGLIVSQSRHTRAAAVRGGLSGADANLGQSLY
jgi:hypothetical protein